MVNFKMEHDIYILLQAILENQEKQFKVHQYEVNLLEAIAEKNKIDLKEVQKNG